MDTNTFRVGRRECACGHPFHSTSLVALTGGPGSGKTAILEMAVNVFCRHIGVLPEAAGVAFGGGFPRHDTLVAQRAAQRAIFRIQEEMEALTVGERQVAVALCDRGTVDGVAYWPGRSDDYWAQFGTTLDEQLERYAAVVHLRTPSSHQGYNHSNVLRTESASDALALDEKILAAWSSHPNRLIVDAADDFLGKAQAALSLVRDALPACCQAHDLPGEL